MCSQLVSVIDKKFSSKEHMLICAAAIMLSQSHDQMPLVILNENCPKNLNLRQSLHVGITGQTLNTNHKVNII